MLKRYVPLLAALVLAVGLPGTARAADQLLYTEMWPNEASLKYGNGNKIVIGKLNSLHAVFADIGSEAIGYLYSIDTVGTLADEGGGNSWESWWFNRSETVSMPTVAVDSSGKAHVVWVEGANAGEVGKIFYSRQTQIGCTYNWCWTTPLKIVNSGTEPSLVAQGNQLHLAWTNRYQVRYTTFTASAPPTAAVLGDIVHYSVCPETRFFQPSVAITSVPCQNTPKIAFLVTVNEPQTFGICTEGAQVGPKVFSRNMTNGTWAQMGDFLTPLQPALPADPAAHSLSLGSNPASQSLYLAWSDEIDGSVRTQTTYSRGPGWVWGVPQNLSLSGQKRYVHIRGRSPSAGQFRVAVSGPEAGSYPTLAPSVWYGTGKWSNPAAPTLAPWLEGPVFMAGGDYPEGLTPQALFWRRCSGANPREVKSYGVFSDLSWPDLMVYESAPCNSPSVTDGVLMQLCQQLQPHTLVGLVHFVVHGTVRDTGSGLDFGDGVVTALDDKGALVTTAEGAKLQITWPAGGKVLSSWENGFFVSVPAESLRISSDVPYKIEDLGWLENKAPGK